MPKLHKLLDMKISEISLVMNPASPGADVLFTKKRDDIIKFDEDQPRDDRGRWTRTMAALGRAGTTTKDTVRRVTRALSDRAKFAAEATVGNTVSAVLTTRAKGAFPVQGGGVQFNFEHFLRDKTRIDTSVQIRPEHLARSSLPASERGAALLGTLGPTHLQRGLDVVHRALVTSGLDVKQPFGTASYAGGANRPGGLFSGLWRASFTRPQAPAQPGGYSSSYTSSGTQQPQLSTQAGGLSGSGAGGIPTYTPSSIPPDWSKDVRAHQPEGWGQKDEATRAQIPLPAPSTARTAGGWAYYRNGSFIPYGDPDQQEHVERVHDWLRAGGESAMQEAKRLTGTASSSKGKGFFTPEHLDYVPAGRGATDNAQYADQQNWVNRYNRERARLSAIATAGAKSQAGVPHTPAPLQERRETDQEQIARHMRERGITKMPDDPELSNERSQKWDIRPPTVAKSLFAHSL